MHRSDRFPAKTLGKKQPVRFSCLNYLKWLWQVKEKKGLINHGGEGYGNA